MKLNLCVLSFELNSSACFLLQLRSIPAVSHICRSAICLFQTQKAGERAAWLENEKAFVNVIWSEDIAILFVFYHSIREGQAEICGWK